MPRGPRLEGPAALHHLMVRGIEGRRIFVTDADRKDLLDCIAAVVDTVACQVLAWALLPNHFHLRVRTGPRPWRLLTVGTRGAERRAAVLASRGVESNALIDRQERN
jgi:hypothetical protein